jgi:hypothetical protein
MYAGKTVFAQLMEYAPRYTFRRLVAKYRSDFNVRTFSCLDQFLCMAFAQLTFRESLRDIVACLRAQPTKLYHLGIRGTVSRSALADANEGRNWRIYCEFAEALICLARRLYAKEPIGVQLSETVYALDSTTIDLCLSLFPWHPFRDTKAAVKLHTLLDLHGAIPTFLHISDGKLHDVNVLDLLIPEPAAFYVMDRGQEEKMITKLLKFILLMPPLMTGFISSAMAIQLDGKIQASVVGPDNTGIYTYQYTVQSEPANIHNIRSIQIDHLKPNGALDLPMDNLLIIERVNPPLPQMTYQEYRNNLLLLRPTAVNDPAVVPIGFTPPDGWFGGLTADFTVLWSAMDPEESGSNYIHPGEAKGGFQLTSYGLPGIRTAKIFAKTDILTAMENAFREAFATTPYEQMTFDQIRAINKSVVNQTAIPVMTIGPTAPPQNFVPLEFVSYIIDLRQKAETHRWITQTSAPF